MMHSSGRSGDEHARHVAIRRTNADTLVDALDVLIERGVVLMGDLQLGVAEIPLVEVGLRLYLRGVNRSGAAPGPHAREVRHRRERTGGNGQPAARSAAAPRPLRTAEQHTRFAGPRSPSSEALSAAPLPEAPLPEDRAVSERPSDAAHGLAQLVIVLVDILRQLMERQAIRRLEAGELSDDDAERLGRTFEALKTTMDELTQWLGPPSEGDAR